MKSIFDTLKNSARHLATGKANAAYVFEFMGNKKGRRKTKRRSQRTLNFETLQPRTLMATFATTDGAWSDPGTWDNGVPDASQRAIIGHGVTVELDDDSHVAQELVIQGNLVVTEDASKPNKTLETRWVHVNSGGVFSVGSVNDRYDVGDFTLTLTGTDVEADHLIETNMGGNNPGIMNVENNDGFLMTEMGGSLQFFGEEKLSFTKLAATAEPGPNATSITVANVIERNFSHGQTDASGNFITTAADDGEVNWEAGDQIVIASSSYDYTDEEVRTITSVFNNGDTTTLTFAEPLENRHYGEIEYYSDATDTTGATRNYEIDLRAEVALLSRNVKIQGLQGVDSQDTDNEFGDRGRLQLEARVRAAGLSDAEFAAAPDQQVANGVGGHLMFMRSSGAITIDGVQLDGLGQSSQKGRYPIHWHNGADTRSGDVLRNSSITNSNNRGVTIHGTNNLNIEGVVLHDIHGHGFFFEDATETGNKLVGNLALGIHTVGGNDANFSNPGGRDPFVVDTHDSVLETGSRFSSSAAFWITNPNNTFVGNIAAGAGDQRTDDWAGDPGPAGTGFWYAIPRVAIGDASGTGVTPIFAEFGKFDYNSSHSTAVGLNFDRGSDIEDADSSGADFDSIQPANEYSPRVGGVEGGAKLSYFVNGFTNYKASEAAVYHRGEAESLQYNDLRIADSKNGPWAVSENIYNNSLFVGNSKGNADTSVNVGGPRLYDGAGLYTGSHFAGFSGANAYAFQVEGSSFGPTMYHAFVSTTFQNDGSQNNIAHAVSDFTRGPENEFRQSHDLGRPAQWSKAALDLDGTLTGGIGGGVGYSIVPNVGFLVDADDVLLAGGAAVLTDDIYARIRVENNNDGQSRFEGDFKNSLNETLLRFINQDGEVIEATEGQNNGDRSWIQIAAKTDGDGNVEGTFTVEFGRQGVPENGFVLNMKNQDGGRPGLNQQILDKVNAARIVVKIPGAVNYTPSNNGGVFTEVFNDTDLRTATSGVTYLRNDTTGDLYLNMGIVDSQERINFIRDNGGALQTIFDSRPAESRQVKYGTTIQAEHFDNGIEGIAYHDTDATNTFGSFRNATGVDATSNAIGNIEAGEWLEYTTQIHENAFNVGINVSSAVAGGKIRFFAGRSNSAGFLRDFGTVDVPDTEGDFETVWFEGVDLTSSAGDNSVIRIAFEGGDFSGVEVDSIQFAAATQTSVEQGRTIKADFETTTIELEEYDIGGQGAAYFDDTPEILDYQSESFDIAGNDSSDSYRTDEDVDANEDGVTGKVFKGEWLEYTTNIQAGEYDITLKKFWGGQGNKVKLFIANDNSATEEAEFELLGVFEFMTNDDNEQITLTETVDLTPWAGTDRVIRVEIDGNWMGLDSLEFVSKTQVAPNVDIVDVSPDPRNTNAGVVTINFDEDVTGLDVGDLTLTRDGNAIDLSNLILTQVLPSQYTIDLSSVTESDGSYELIINSVGSGISDNAGNALATGAIDQFMIDSGGDPTFLLGDINQDGIVNFMDISPFVSILGDGGFLDEADTNGDGVVDFLDISGFIAALTNQ